MTSITLLVMVVSSGDNPPAVKDANATVNTPAATDQPVTPETT